MSQLRQAELNEQYLRRAFCSRRRRRSRIFRPALGRLVELRIAVDAAQQALDVAEGSYAAGTGIYLERLVAQDQLLNAATAGKRGIQPEASIPESVASDRRVEKTADGGAATQPSTRLLTTTRPADTQPATATQPATRPLP